MNLADVMDELGTALEGITGLRVSPFPADQVQPPAAVVGYPETITFDMTYGRGVDSMQVPVYVLVGKAWDRTARDRLAVYCHGSGASSIKAVLEGGEHTAMSSVRVVSADFQVVTVASVDYLAAVFSVDVFGSGG